MSELLPCPFCGNDGSGPAEEALHVSMTEHDWRAASWSVQCDKCTATMGYSDSEDAAVEDWNTRASQGELERLRSLEAELWRLSLVLESAVRNADRPNHADVLALIKSIKRTDSALSGSKDNG